MLKGAQQHHNAQLTRARVRNESNRLNGHTLPLSLRSIHDKAVRMIEHEERATRHVPFG